MPKKKLPSDFAHEETDKIIQKLEKRVTKEYATAVKETSEKLDKHMKQFEAESAKKLALVKSGEMTSSQYKKWLRDQTMTGKQWTDMRNVLAKDFNNADKIAKSIASGYTSEVYALNHNFSTYLIEKQTGISTSYTLYSRESAERILRKSPKILPDPGKEMRRKLAEGKAIKWQEGRIQSATLQAILQGESIPNMAKRICKTVGASNMSASIRYARTAMTGAENAGRIDAYKRANEMGIETQKTWIATLDSKTRHWHAELDGATVPVDEPFENEVGKIMYPGDPDADGENIWNCRCTMISSIKGGEIDVTDGRLSYSDELGSMTYEEWKGSHG